MGRREAISLVFCTLALAACASPPLPTVIPSSTPEPRLTQLSFATTTEAPTATLSAEEQRAARFQPLLLTLDDFPEGIEFSEASLRDNLSRSLLDDLQFSDVVGFSFEHSGTDLLAGILGFLDEETLVKGFDAALENRVNAELDKYAQQLADPDAAPFSAEEQAHIREFSVDELPADAIWASDFIRTEGRLVRLDVVGFRRGEVGLLLLYVSSPTREPLIDLAQVTALLAERAAAQ